MTGAERDLNADFRGKPLSEYSDADRDFIEIGRESGLEDEEISLSEEANLTDTPESQGPDWILISKEGRPYGISADNLAAEFESTWKGALLNKGGLWFRWDGKSWGQISDGILEKEIRERTRLVAPGLLSGRVLHDTLGFLSASFEAGRDFEFNQQKHRISFANGTLDLRTGDFREHQREDFISILLPYAYDPQAECPRWRQFMAEVLPPEQYIDVESATQRLQEWAGYCLVSTPKLEKCLYLYGRGANGKSTFLEILKALVGAENCAAIEPARLTERFQLLGIYGKLLNICSDIETRAVLSGEFKKIVSGDTCTTDVKGKDLFTFNPFAKHLFSANDFLATRDRSYGFFRRFDTLNFRAQFPREARDTSLRETLLSELPGIFNWALEGLRRLEANKFRLSISPDFAACRAEYEVEASPVLQFLSACTSPDPNGRVPAGQLYSAYSDWCQTSGHRPLSSTLFGREIKASAGYEKVRGRENGERYYAYVGLTLSTDRECVLSKGSSAGRKTKP